MKYLVLLLFVGCSETTCLEYQEYTAISFKCLNPMDELPQNNPAFNIMCKETKTKESRCVVYKLE